MHAPVYLSDMASRLILLLLLIAVPACAAGDTTGFDRDRVEAVVEQARAMPRLHSLLVLHAGEPVVEHVQGGPGLDRPANIKSLSKTVLASLAGIAIDQGVVRGTGQSIMELLGPRAPARAPDAAAEITLDHALTMSIGLASTSGAHYGRWVQSDDWVAHVLTRPVVDRPGGQMIYSTGSTHLVSAALTQASGRSTLALAREWLGEPLNIRIPSWLTDPQGIYFGGNEMLLSPRALARFGEAWRLGGSLNGRRVIPDDWIDASWTARSRSPWTGDDYGYGWFITTLGGERAYYGRGFGGQLLYVIPARQLTIVITSDPNPPGSGGLYFRQLQSLVARTIVPAAARSSP